jgi:hypothetical protein
MQNRRDLLEEFDRQVGTPAPVSLAAVDIKFWNLVDLFLKVYFAWIVASAIIGSIVGLAFGGFWILRSVLTQN